MVSDDGMIYAGEIPTHFVKVDVDFLAHCLVSSLPQFLGDGMVSLVALIPEHLVKATGSPLVHQGYVSPLRVPVLVIVGAQVNHPCAWLELERHVVAACDEPIC